MENVVAGQQSSVQNNRLAIAGRMTLNQGQYSRMNRSKPLLQQVDNDDQFDELPNIVTSYIPIQSPEHRTLNKNDKGSRLQAKQMPRQKQMPHKTKDFIQAKKTHTKIYNQRSSERFSMNQLEDVQAIIQEIQQVMDSTQISAKRSPFLNQTPLNNHNKKKNWQTNGKNIFNKDDAFSKLQQMLLNYNSVEKPPQQSEQKAQIKNETLKNVRRYKNEQRLNRFRAYNEISTSLNDNTQASQHKTVGDNNIQNKIELNLKSQVNQKEEAGINFENVQILQIDWMRLPIILSHVVEDNVDIFLQMKDFPVQQNFVQVISQSLVACKTYSSYSIFNAAFEAGINKSKGMMSEQQFRERWAEQWSQQIEDQQHKQMLCEFDLHWYRSLIEYTFNHSLQDLLIKNIAFDINKYLSNLAKINNKVVNDKNTPPITTHHSLIHQLNSNKLLYALRLVQKTIQVKKKKKSNEIFMVAGVIARIYQNIDRDSMVLLNKQLKQEGGKIYQVQKMQQSLGVIVKVSSQAKIDFHEKYLQVAQLRLYLSEESHKQQRYMWILGEKKKGRMISLMVKQRMRQLVEVQVGEQMYFGRKYYILLD